MKVNFYVNGEQDPVASAELEVVPRGIYTIDGVDYLVNGQPQFIVKDGKLIETKLLAQRIDSSVDMDD